MSLLSPPNEILLQIADELNPKPLFRLLLTPRFLSTLLTPLLNHEASPLLTLPNKVILRIARNLSLKPLSRLLRTSPFHKRLLTPLLHDLVSSNDAESSLLWAAGKGHESLINILLEKAVGVNFWDYRTRATAIHIAMYCGYEGIVEILLENRELDVDVRDFDFGTVLHYAVEMRYSEIIPLLLDIGVDVNAKNLSGDTALHIAARRVWGYDNCKILLEQGVDTEARNMEANTAILGASNFEVLQLLCENGADVNAQDLKGMTLLHHAVNMGHRSMVEALLKNGANTELREGDYKKTTLHMAALRGDEEIVQMLLEKGAMVDGKDENGVTPLSKAVIARSAAT